jgi:hypothetical protein
MHRVLHAPEANRDGRQSHCCWPPAVQLSGVERQPRVYSALAAQAVSAHAKVVSSLEYRDNTPCTVLTEHSTCYRGPSPGCEHHVHLC